MSNETRLPSDSGISSCDELRCSASTTLASTLALAIDEDDEVVLCWLAASFDPSFARSMGALSCLPKLSMWRGTLGVVVVGVVSIRRGTLCASPARGARKCHISNMIVHCIIRCNLSHQRTLSLCRRCAKGRRRSLLGSSVQHGGGPPRARTGERLRRLRNSPKLCKIFAQLVRALDLSKTLALLAFVPQQIDERSQVLRL